MAGGCYAGVSHMNKFSLSFLSVALVGGKLEAERRKNPEWDKNVFFSISHTIRSNSAFSRYLRHSSFKSFAYFSPHQLYHYSMLLYSHSEGVWRHIYSSSSVIHLRVWLEEPRNWWKWWMRKEKSHFKYHNITSYYTFTDMWRNIKKWK